ncbi:hypothetical protein [Cognatishimia sp. MH4019]|uniref:hypothetical protein n=1 Tax=Cognatishimia sp. MH4019 TaxID=2854030 RepID=UPI001CD815B4|nr:hypothetical protein [Cognatishimia sp. MH4019]
MRGFIALLAVGGLVACAPAVPDSNPDRGAGVGFGSYSEYQQRQLERDRALQGSSLPAAAPVTAQTLDPASATTAPATTGGPTPAKQALATQPVTVPRAGSTAPQTDDAAQIAAGARAALSNSSTEPVQASPSNPAPTIVNNPGISDEQDFDAVSARQTIESDAERRARQAAQYQVIAPTAVPERQASGPNIIEYALSTRHAKGEQIVRRVGFNLANKNRRNCAGFESDDAAQEEFLRLGGPNRDRLALDPDGDGFACGWDPAPFRRAINN